MQGSKAEQTLSTRDCRMGVPAKAVPSIKLLSWVQNVASRVNKLLQSRLNTCSRLHPLHKQAQD